MGCRNAVGQWTTYEDACQGGMMLFRLEDAQAGEPSLIVGNSALHGKYKPRLGLGLATSKTWYLPRHLEPYKICISLKAIVLVFNDRVSSSINLIVPVLLSPLLYQSQHIIIIHCFHSLPSQKHFLLVVYRLVPRHAY